MNRIATGLAIVALIAFQGCVVSQSTHEQTLQDLQATKSDLDRTRVQNEALNKQLKVVQESKVKLKEDLDKATTEVAGKDAAVAKERQAAETKVKDLERQVKELTAAKKTLAQELEVQKQRGEDRLKILKRQQKELKEREQAELLTPPVLPKPAPPATNAPTPPVPNPQEKPGTANPAPVSPPSSASAKPPVAEPVRPPELGPLVDVNKSSETDLILLGLGKEDTQKLIKNRPYKTKDELVTKAGISRDVVDRFKDKLIVGQ